MFDVSGSILADGPFAIFMLMILLSLFYGTLDALPYTWMFAPLCTLFVLSVLGWLPDFGHGLFDLCIDVAIGVGVPYAVGVALRKMMFNRSDDVSR